MKEEGLKLADGGEHIAQANGNLDSQIRGYLMDMSDMIRKLVAELDKQGEPVGKFYWESVVDGHVMAVPSEGTPHYNNGDFPLYTTPQTKPLSDEEIEGIAVKWYVGTRILPIGFARAIEERHGIK